MQNMPPTIFFKLMTFFSLTHLRAQVNEFRWPQLKKKTKQNENKPSRSSLTEQHKAEGAISW